MNVAADATVRPTAKGRVGDPFSSPWRRRLPLLPALLFMILVTQLPFLVSIYYSLTNLKDKTQSLIPEPTKFVGIENYRAIFSDPFFRQAMWTSVQMPVFAVVLSVLFGTLFAILLDRRFFGQGLIRTLLITPFLLMPVVAALIWKQQMFSSLFGILDKVLAFLGLNSVAFISDNPLGSIYIVQPFHAIDVMTGGGPGSTNVPYFVYQESIGGGFRYGSASAYAIVVVIFAIIIATFALRLLSGLLKDEERA